jgi:hypothetical protein
MSEGRTPEVLDEAERIFATTERLFFLTLSIWQRFASKSVTLLHRVRSGQSCASNTWRLLGYKATVRNPSTAMATANDYW